MEEREKALKDMLYGLARLAITFLVALFSGIITTTVGIAIIGNIVNGEGRTFDEKNLSYIAFAIMFILLCRLFFDDGKRHAAYSRHDTVTASIVCIACMALYFVPVLFLKYVEDYSTLKLYDWLYKPLEWINYILGDMTMSVMIGSVVLCAALIFFYWLGGKCYYRRLHRRVLRDS